jgi:hypothetical protein
MSRVPTIRVLNMVAYAEEVVSKILAHCSVMKPRCASRGITLITVITKVFICNSKVVIVDIIDLTSRFHLTQQATRGVIILVERYCHLSRTHATGKLFAEQVQDFLAFPLASNLLGIAHKRPRGREGIESECEQLLLPDISPGHKQGGLMLASLAFEDRCAIDDSGQPNRASHLIEHIFPVHLARVVDRQGGNTVYTGRPE